MAPIAPTAERAQILSMSAEALDRLAGLPGTTVAILSGRDLTDLSRKVPEAERSWMAPEGIATLDGPEELADWLLALAQLRAAVMSDSSEVSA